MQYAYSIYGLRLDVDRPLPGLVNAAGNSPTDVTVWSRRAPEWVTRDTRGVKELRFDSGDAGEGLPSSIQAWQYVESGAFQVAYRDGVQFVIAGSGESIFASFDGTATFQDAASYLVGAILGFALRLKGRVALHASVVAIDGRAVVLLGDAGSGKSTTAAAFAFMGYPVLADDVCALAEDNGDFLVGPSYPGIRLWPDAVESMFGVEDALPRVTPGWGKRLLDLSIGDCRFQSSSLPIGALYRLLETRAPEEVPSVKRLRASERMMNLVTMSYPDYLLDDDMKSKQFDVLARLASRVPGGEVRIYADLSAVPEVCRVIVEDFQESRHRV